MTSWDELEAYLSRLVENVGGSAYVLRDSEGRHLAPRPPAMDNETLVQAAIERFVRKRRGEDLPTDDAGESAEQEAIRELSRFVDLAERFKGHSAALDGSAGADFVKKGPGKRYVHRQAELPFIAERFLSSYLLIIAFGDVGAVDAGGVVLALERARSVISGLLEDLPPDGGGDRALSNAKRSS